MKACGAFPDISWPSDSARCPRIEICNWCHLDPSPSNNVSFPTQDLPCKRFLKWGHNLLNMSIVTVVADAFPVLWLQKSSLCYGTGPHAWIQDHVDNHCKLSRNVTNSKYRVLLRTGRWACTWWCLRPFQVKDFLEKPTCGSTRHYTDRRRENLSDTLDGCSR